MHCFPKVFTLMACALLALSACGGSAPTPTPVSPDAIYTQAAETVVAQLTETAKAAPPSPTDTLTPLVSPTVKETITPLITDTPGPGTPSATPFTVTTPRPTQLGSCDNYQFGGDVTIPDGSQVTAGSSFVKTWRVKNAGPCNWTTNYHLIYGWGGDGTKWSSTPSVKFPSAVKVGDNVDLSVTLTAPTKAGTYSAAFRLQNDKGYNFGSPNHPGDYLFVTIVVK